MINLYTKSIKQCDEYIIQLLSFLYKVYEITYKNENVEVTKTYIGEFGEQLEELVKFIQENKMLNELILQNECDLKFALESFGSAFHIEDYDLCSEILKYEIQYILCKWRDKLNRQK